MPGRFRPKERNVTKRGTFRKKGAGLRRPPVRSAECLRGEPARGSFDGPEGAVRGDHFEVEQRPVDVEAVGGPVQESPGLVGLELAGGLLRNGRSFLVGSSEAGGSGGFFGLVPHVDDEGDLDQAAAADAVGPHLGVEVGAIAEEESLKLGRHDAFPFLGHPQVPAFVLVSVERSVAAGSAPSARREIRGPRLSRSAVRRDVQSVVQAETIGAVSKMVDQLAGCRRSFLGVLQELF
jgi:hypothetical protein